MNDNKKKKNSYRLDRVDSEFFCNADIFLCLHDEYYSRRGT